jgi:hypothetical protein
VEAAGGRRVEQWQRRVAQLAGALLEPRGELLGHVVGGGQDGEREPHVGAAAGDRDLGDDQVGRLEPRPVPSGAAVVGEREAANGHETGAGRPVRRVGFRRARQLAPGGGGLPEAPRAAAGEVRRAAERGQGGAAAIGLLEAEPGLACAPRGEGDGARIDGRRHGDRDRGEHLSPAAPRAPDGALAPLAQPFDDGGGDQNAHGSAVKVRRPVEQRSSTRPLGDRRTEVTDTVPVAPVAVTWPSTFTRKRSRPTS